MHSSKTLNLTKPKLLLFGPQAQTWTEETLQDLRTVILSSPSRFQWMLDVIAELPALWEDGARNLPSLSLQLPNALSQLEALRKCFTPDQLSPFDFPMPNILLTPLVVLTHLAQYTLFLDSLQDEAADSDARPSLNASATLGLCTGLLSALAVSASRTRESLSHWGPVAVRLAMLIGASVDADDAEAEAQSFTVSWGPKESSDTLHGIVEKDARRYVSVFFDERRVTVTTAQSDASELTRQLKGAGLGVGDVSLKGQFHCARHQKITELLIEYCHKRPHIQFPPTDGLVVPTLFALDSMTPAQEKFHVIALRAILLHPAQWYSSFLQAQSRFLQSDDDRVVCFGPERCVPRSLLSQLGTHVVQVSELDLGPLKTGPAADMLPYLSENHLPLQDCRIAVVGMACRLPGATDLDQFSSLLRQGRSQHIEVPRHRFDMDTVWRPLDPKRQWYGNFLDDYDSFDHRFFKRTAREAASMDPQHRLILQAAYQALEQSGYFHNDVADKHIGCFLGVGLVDYENNIACHPATAYSATGNLKSFAAGRISHHFGWTGPSLTLDTACSSSAVAVHQACRAILHGECPAALAGAVNLMTSPDWFHNLAGASFLSPTGQCKPFDSKADGYCRGEAVGALVLKNYAVAMADGDQILGVIAATEVFQNENCTPITVPNAVSLSSLFRTVVKQAQLEPSQVTVVEAHGTGTPVGDPAEYESIKQVFACPERLYPVSLCSVKGLVGHGEPASGITALIKILLMAREGFIPPQPSFTTINPAINSSDQIEISRELKPWTAKPRVALINNYGASGSNASLVITQAPSPDILDAGVEAGIKSISGSDFPFWLSGLDQDTIRRYASRLREFLAKQDDELQLSTLSFHMSRQSNRSLDYAAIICCNNINDLDAKLAGIEQGAATPVVLPTRPRRPVILCFGGQISTFVGLDRAVHDTVSVLRQHLYVCNSAAMQLGLPSIYPGIFQRSAVNSIVQLQVMLFSIQYACAKSWIDCGLSVTAVVGHSFGELTALCVSGGLTLQDALTMISVRAQLIEEYWGADKGVMMAVESDLAVVQQILDIANKGAANTFASIACVNAARSFTIAGPVWAIDRVGEVMQQPAYASAVRAKRLNVTNAFHSSLVDPLVPRLTELGRKLQFKEPTIPWERATETDTKSTLPLPEDYVAQHMRRPVHFASAVQRLAQRHPSAVWLEAGSNSTITSLASRALGSEVQRTSHFQPINITTDKTFQSLADATSTLWKEGVRIDFWPHHTSQAQSYPSLLLPPYQFDYCPHWMELKKPETAALPPSAQHFSPEPPTKLWSLVYHTTTQKPQTARFQIHTDSAEYQGLVAGHVVVQTNSICPSVFQIEFTIDALTSLQPQLQQGQFHPQLHGMQSHGPLGLAQTGTVWLDVKALDQSALGWDFSIGSESQPGAKLTPHASGRIVFLPSNDEQTQAEFARYARLIPLSRCQALLSGVEIDEAMQGRSIYKNFVEIVNYSLVFKGLRKIVSRGLESAGRVNRLSKGTRYVDTGLLDSFCQVAGIFINCMTEVPEGDMFISDRVERWMRNPRLHALDAPWPDAFDVFAISQRVSDREMLSDVFVFDPVSGDILEVALGIHYQRLPKVVMRQVVAKINGTSSKAASTLTTAVPVANGDTPQATATLTTKGSLSAPVSAENPSPIAAKASGKADIFAKVRILLCELSGLDPEDIKVETGLGDIGIDSLMGMEVAREIENTFKCSLDVSELENLTDVASLMRCIQGTGF
ncbi:hypothetical protein BDW59DRAFT_167582 [Aspergillus cavernicola]|uniref:Polyketide synthase n=1 Tax=Aspergillus cavernicola TaxID=176166 RepID=A0ABR4HCS0_9EURO